ncbi:MAG: hypothetical protein RIR51_1557 [Bacteroidota bacterium]|jgi:isoquinoline 1-oxidoreductase alpha subunit
MKYDLTINGKKASVEADPDSPLLWVIRDYVGLKGTKFGCGLGLCGACTVHLDGLAIRSCQTMISTVDPNAKITTIESEEALIKKVQDAWEEYQVPQCGYCQSGQIMSAVSLLKSNPHPSEEDIEQYMSGNICRCGTYLRIKKAIISVANS